MIVKIQVRSDDGKYRDAFADEFSQAAYGKVLSFTGWGYLRETLGRFCINQAHQCSCDPAAADRWFRRYQSIREIE